MKSTIALLTLILLTTCSKKNSESNPDAETNELATAYVRLGLMIGQYDTDFVDAYYGSDSLKPTAIADTVFPADSLLKQVAMLRAEAQHIVEQSASDKTKKRALWLGKQLTAFERRVRIVKGESTEFDAESKELFDAVAPVYAEVHFKQLIGKLDSILPGNGDITKRFQSLAARFLIPKEKIDTIFKTTIAEARKRTLAHYKLPEGEDFKMEYVHDKPWSGYNWYQGNYKSIIQINVSQPIFIERAIDLACHEGYPGHHVYNCLLEKNLYRDKGWPEIALYPLFSPQSLIAEGSANYGISLAFPGDEQKEYCKKVLLPIAGMDPLLADQYFEALELRNALNYARNEVARGILNGKMTDREALRWLSSYCLLSPKGSEDYLRFIRKYRSYVINYNYGQDLVKTHIESQTQTDRWKAFEVLLSNEASASDLTK